MMRYENQVKPVARVRVDDGMAEEKRREERNGLTIDENLLATESDVSATN